MSRRAEARRAAQARTRWLMVWAAAGVAFVAALVAVVVVLGGDDDGTGTSAGSGLRVSMTDYAFSPDPVVLSGDDKVITVVNDGELPHDFVVPELGKGTPDLAPGEELTIDLSGQPSGTYEVICDITGHREAGMFSTLTID